MKDLADQLAPDVEKTSIRKLAAEIHVSKTTIENIVKRRLKTMPKVRTLEKIANYYSLTLPAVVEMAGAVLGDSDRFARLAREMERAPWLVNRFDELMQVSEEEFNYFLDMREWRKKKKPPPDSPPPLPTE